MTKYSTDTLPRIRERIHNKSHEYFTFNLNRKTKAQMDMFYGATDALLDASTAAASYNRAISNNSGANLLACYGFLQALYVQQDAVGMLSRAIGLSWNVNSEPRLREIRNVRNRLAGHPARTERVSPTSSAIISYNEIASNCFRGHVYYEDHTETINVEVATFLSDNERLLLTQMQAIEFEMDRAEQDFRTTQSAQPLANCFDQKFEYLLQRLHCDLLNAGRLAQAQAHAKLIRDAVVALRQTLDQRNFQTESSRLHLNRILAGLGQLDDILGKVSHKEDDQFLFDVLYKGVETYIQHFKVLLQAIDRKILTPVE